MVQIRVSPTVLLLVVQFGENNRKTFVSDVGFEPTPSSEDQNSHTIPYLGTRQNLESGALDHSANLTLLENHLNLLVQKVK